MTKTQRTPSSPVRKHRQRFKILAFQNKSGTPSWRVAGVRRDGVQVRENFREIQAAQCRQLELETEWLGQQSEVVARATELTHEQLRLAEVAFKKLDGEWERLLDAVDYWKAHGKQAVQGESPRLDEAIDQYQKWLVNSPLRAATKSHWRTRMNVFRNSTLNVRVCQITPDFIDDFLRSRNLSPSGKDTDRRAISRFLSWCIERPRRWASTNPCREVRVECGESSPPKVLSIDECARLLDSAEAHKGGLLVPYVVVCLFGGLRPSEAARLQGSQVNLADREILLEGTQTKTKRPRLVRICDTLHKWLAAHSGKVFFPSNWRKEFESIRRAARIQTWPSDIMRHTAISHYFRKTGSYGQTAEQFGTSEAIIKKHYQGRVSSEETEAFYGLLP